MKVESVPEVVSVSRKSMHNVNQSKSARRTFKCFCVYSGQKNHKYNFEARRKQEGIDINGAFWILRLREACQASGRVEWAPSNRSWKFKEKRKNFKSLISLDRGGS